MNRHTTPITRPRFSALLEAVDNFANTSGNLATAHIVNDFLDNFHALKTEREVHAAKWKELVPPLKTSIRQISFDIEKISAPGLSSAFGYFMNDAGCGMMAAAIQALPGYYNKIDRAINDHPQVKEKFEGIKNQITALLPIDSQRLSEDLVNSLGAIEAVILTLRDFKEPDKCTLQDIKKLNAEDRFKINVSPFTASLFQIGADLPVILREISDHIKRDSVRMENVVYLNAIGAFLRLADAVETSSLPILFSKLVGKK